MNTAQQNMLLQTQNQQADVQQSTVQSDQAMLSDQNNFADTQYFSDPSEQVTPKDQRTAVPTKPTKQQLLEAEIDQAFHEVFEIDQQNPTEDNPHAAVFDEMADDLYQAMLQEQAKEEASAGLLPAQTNAAATGWTNNGNIQYNMQEEISAAPIAQQEYLRQFWDETKQRFSAVKLLFGIQPYSSFQPAHVVEEDNHFRNDNDTSDSIDAHAVQPINAINHSKILKTQDVENEDLKKQDKNQIENIKERSEQYNRYLNNHLGHLKDKVQITQYHTAKSVNDWWAKQGYDNPPYAENTIIQVITLKEDIVFVRVYDGEISGMYGGWVMNANDIKGLTAAQVQDKYALPAIPKYIAEVKLKAGDTISMGQAAPIFGANGGGTQFDLMGQYIGEFNEIGNFEDWSFKNE